MIAVPDDSFSALDNKTKGQVIANLLGANGHFRKLGTTVILTANSAEFLLIPFKGRGFCSVLKPSAVLSLYLADELILLEDGKAAY